MERYPFRGEYLIEIEGKHKLKPEGLQLFTHIMAKSKVVENINTTITQSLDVTSTTEIYTKNNNIAIEYINSLKQQVEDLKEDKVILQKQLN